MPHSTDATQMPALFLSHGSPMVALDHGPYQEALADYGRAVQPRAIVAVSAHWGSGTAIEINAARQHSAMYDFGGFPPALYELKYDPPGAPTLATQTAERLSSEGFEAAITEGRGLDHGVWIPLRLMYPEANIPVVEISVPLRLAAEELYQLGRALAPLRGEGVMLVGSGGVVHNLRLVNFAGKQAPVDAWAAEFDTWFSHAVIEGRTDELFDYRKAAPYAELAVPTFEHFAPVFVVLGAGSPDGKASTIFAGFEHGNISMRSFAVE